MSQRLEDTLANLSEKVSEIREQVAVSHTLHERNSRDLELHIKRTDLLQDEVNRLRTTQAWWSITGKVIAVGLPVIALILKLLGVFGNG